MKMMQIEQALGMVRSCLVECAAHEDWSEHRSDELTQVVRDCFRRIAGHAPQRARSAEPRLQRDLLKRAIRFVNDNLDARLTWDDIAAHVGLDRFTFGRRFRFATGITPHQYVIRCRMRKAMKLLARAETSLADVALEVGCSCQSHLTTLFRKHVGTTPGEYRRRARASSSTRLARELPAMARMRPAAAMHAGFDVRA
jgi:AraC-like DNA-binding protein